MYFWSVYKKYTYGNVFICLLTRLEKKISKHHSDNIFLLNFKTIFSLSIYVFLKILFQTYFPCVTRYKKQTPISFQYGRMVVSSYRLTWKYEMTYLKAALTSSTRLICFCIIPCDTFKKSSLDNEPSQSHPASHTIR